jgi:hypothetical protein
MTTIVNPAAPIVTQVAVDQRGTITSPFGTPSAPRLPARDGTQSIVNAVNAAHRASLGAPITTVR